MQTLLIFSHTFWADSKVNRALLEAAKALPNVRIHNLNEIYKDGKIDVDSEIKLLQESEKIICQFLLFWFSTPALMKEWQDLVLSKIHYSANPKLLEGKKFSIITTAGGEAKSYDGHHGYSLETLLSPIKQAFSYSFCDVLESYAIFKAKPDNLPVQEYLKQLQ